MLNIWPFRRHRTWSEQLDAYIDGELGGAARERFEAHVAGCDECAAELAAHRELKQTVRSLPELPVTRSFRITPGMLADAPSAAAQRGAPLVARFMQVTAGVAALAFVSVVGADILSGGGGAQPTRGDLDTGILMESTSGEATGGQLNAADTDGDTPAAAPADDDAPLPPATEGGTSSQGLQPTPQPGQTYDAATDEQGTRDGADVERHIDEDADMPPEPVALRAGDEKDEGLDGLLVAQIGFGSLAVVAGAAWLLVRRGA